MIHYALYVYDSHRDEPLESLDDIVYYLKAVIHSLAHFRLVRRWSRDQRRIFWRLVAPSLFSLVRSLLFQRLDKDQEGMEIVHHETGSIKEYALGFL